MRQLAIAHLRNTPAPKVSADLLSNAVLVPMRAGLGKWEAPESDKSKAFLAAADLLREIEAGLEP